MTEQNEENLAHNRPSRCLVLGALACLLGTVGLPTAPDALAAAAVASATPVPGGSDTPPPPASPAIVASPLPGSPAPDKGRLKLMFGGNRRWCTYPDDRVIRPPHKPGTVEKKNEIFTFGYRFTVSALKRGQADTPLMLYESPVFRTAIWLEASKVGQGRKSGPSGPVILSEGERPKPKDPVTPGTLVPHWQEQYRCVTLPEEMDFDVDAGTYDVYLAFDLLNREGAWVHRSTGYLTDIPVENARSTRLEGRVNLGPGSERHVDIESSSIEPEAAAPARSSGP